MAAQFDLEFDDLNRLRRTFAREVPQIDRQAQSIVNQGAAKIARIARKLVPVDTGDLQGSIRSRQGRVEVGMPYAGFVEFGHLSVAGNPVPPQPYLSPAVDQVMPEIREDLLTAGSEAVGARTTLGRRLVAATGVNFAGVRANQSPFDVGRPRAATPLPSVGR